MTGTGDLKGLRILVVEDEYLVATDIVEAIETLGGEVVGPCPDLDAARRLLREELLDGAVVDLNLKGELGEPLARQIADRGVPILYYTGYGTSPSGEELPAGRKAVKPLTLDALMREMLRSFVPSHPSKRAP